MKFKKNSSSSETIKAFADAAKEGWFENYDWAFRANPYVIIRNDTFSRQNQCHV